MGLFNKKKKQDPKKQEPPKVLYQPWNTAPFRGVYRLPPEHEAMVYTYDGTPFQGLTVNTKLVIAAVPGDVQMTSIYTGTTTSSFDYGDVAYEYNGYIFGLSASHAEAVKKMMMSGYRVEVEAYISGYDADYGFPKVRGLFGYIDDNIYMSL